MDRATIYDVTVWDTTDGMSLDFHRGVSASGVERLRKKWAGMPHAEVRAEARDINPDRMDDFDGLVPRPGR